MAGFYALYFVQLTLHHEQMQEAIKDLPENQLEKFSFTPEEFEKVKRNNREITVEGRMYDIANLQHINNIIIVWALHDEKEDSLLSLITHLVEKPVEKGFPVQVFQFLGMMYVVPEFELKPVKEVTNEFVTMYRMMISENTSGIQVPPPEQGINLQ
jgi:hypothetical protein